MRNKQRRAPSQAKPSREKGPELVGASKTLKAPKRQRSEDLQYLFKG